MTNKEIKTICKEMQSKHCKIDWRFRVTQTNTQVKIYWEYISKDLKSNPWTIDKIDLIVNNEHGEFMNWEIESNNNLKDTIKSVVYYLNSRY